MKYLRLIALAIFALAIPALADPPSAALLGGIARCTPALDVPAGGIARCLVVAQTPPDDPLYLLSVRLMANKHRNVTQWGYSYSANKGVRTTGYYAEEYDASALRTTRFCQVIVDPADAALTVRFSVRAEGVLVDEVTELTDCPEKWNP